MCLYILLLCVLLRSFFISLLSFELLPLSDLDGSAAVAMAVELVMGYRNDGFLESAVAQEAASGLESVEKFIKMLSQSQRQPEKGLEVDCGAAADAAVTKFKRVISLLGRARTGHARFRRAPLSSPRAPPPAPIHQTKDQSPESETIVYCATPLQQLPPTDRVVMIKNGAVERREPGPKTINFSYSTPPPAISAASSFMSSLTTGEKDHGKQQSTAFQLTNLSAAQALSAGKPPPSSSSLKRKCSSSENNASGKCSGSSGKCHCSKRRKLRRKREVRIPAISAKMADIPPDDYSWRKYGQKPIKGSPHPRGYYKCSSVRGCPARKHVERALDDPNMLVVTYEGEHNHPLSIAETTGLILESS